MFTSKRMVAALAATPLALALVAVGVVAGPASADPPPPTGASYCAAGSDTTQDVVQKLAGTVTSSAATGSKKFESWNATGTTPITTACSATSLYRPNGSGDGIAALRLSLGLNTGSDGYAPTDSYKTAHGVVPSNSISFARSSRGPSDTADTSLTFIPFGVDAVDFAVKSGGALDTNFASGLTSTQLQQIYACTLNTVTVGGVTWTIKPYVPQPGSGTRKFFEGAVGLADSNVNTTCVQDFKVGNPSTTKIEEHDGRVLTDPTVSGVKYAEIVPISIAQNIAQTNHAITGVTDLRGSSKLGTLDAKTPTTGTAPNQVINSAFPTVYTRSVYNVFRTTKVVGAGADAALVNLFVGNSSVVCSATTTIRQFGFLTNASCGSTTLRGKD